jgi:hypothetical protein
MYTGANQPQEHVMTFTDRELAEIGKMIVAKDPALISAMIKAALEETANDVVAKRGADPLTLPTADEIKTAATLLMTARLNQFTMRVANQMNMQKMSVKFHVTPIVEIAATPLELTPSDHQAPHRHNVKQLYSLDHWSKCIPTNEG